MEAKKKCGCKGGGYPAFYIWGDERIPCRVLAVFERSATIVIPGGHVTQGSDFMNVNLHELETERKPDGDDHSHTHG